MKRPTWIWLFCVICALCAVTAYTQSAKKRSLKEQIEALIKRAAAEQAKNPAARAESPIKPLYSELERQYLNGEITARQFMRIMEELQLYGGTNADPRALSVLPQQMRTQFGTNTSPASATNAPGDESATFGEIEKKLDELLQRKAQMDKAAATNAIPETEPKTKREKLDRLLRLLITDKITKQEYEQRREKVMAEPDAP